jgi:hypothetical protein
MKRFCINCNQINKKNYWQKNIILSSLRHKETYGKDETKIKQTRNSFFEDEYTKAVERDPKYIE